LLISRFLPFPTLKVLLLVLRAFSFLLFRSPFLIDGPSSSPSRSWSSNFVLQGPLFFGQLPLLPYLGSRVSSVVAFFFGSSVLIVFRVFLEDELSPPLSLFAFLPLPEGRVTCSNVGPQGERVSFWGPTPAFLN